MGEWSEDAFPSMKDKNEDMTRVMLRGREREVKKIVRRKSREHLVCCVSANLGERNRSIRGPGDGKRGGKKKIRGERGELSE